MFVTAETITDEMTEEIREINGELVMAGPSWLDYADLILKAIIAASAVAIAAARF